MIRIESPLGLEKEKVYVFDYIFNQRFDIKYELIFSETDNFLFKNISGEKVHFSENLLSGLSASWLLCESLNQLAINEYRLTSPHNRVIQETISLPTYKDATPDLIGIIFFLISGYEEVVTDKIDEHGRHKVDNFLVQTNQNEIPVVDMLVEEIWFAIESSFQGLKRKKEKYTIKISHDVDIPVRANCSNVKRILKSLVADIIYRRDIILFSRRFLSLFLPTRLKFALDVNNNYKFLVTLYEKLNLKAAFYFIPLHRNKCFDSFCGNVDNEDVQRIIHMVYSRGHEVGVHPSYNSFINRKVFIEEIEFFRDHLPTGVAKQKEYGGRQHYLRFNNPLTWRLWLSCGLVYDSSLGFHGNELMGFRYGTAHQFVPFDLLSRERLTGIVEIPLLVMDVNHFRSKASLLSKCDFERIIRLNEVCKHFNSCFTLLYHNDTLISKNQKKQYTELLKELVNG